MREKGLEKRNRKVKSVCILTIGLLLMAAAVVSAQDIKPEISAALNAGDTAQAISMLENEISVDKSYHLNYYMLGMIYYNQGKYEQARDQFLTALDKKSKHWESWYQLGLTYLKLGENDKAEKAMRDARKKAGKDEKYIFENGLGLVLMAKGEYQEADRAFRQAIVGDSTVAEYHINLGDANFYAGVPYLAVSEYEKALALDTAGLEVYFHWAEACLEMRDYKCAMEKLRTVLVKDSTHAPAWERAGEIYFKAAMSSRSRSERTERFKETIGSYRRYIELSHHKADSSTVRAFFELAMSYLNLNGFEEAAAYFDTVLQIPYEPRDVYFYYGKALWGARDYVKSGEMLEKHLQWVAQQDEDYNSNIDDGELYQLLGDAWFYREHADDAAKAADYAKAIDYYKKSLAAKPGQARLLYNVAVGYHSAGSYAQALDYYDKRIELGVDSSTAAILKNAGWAALSMANDAAEGGESDEYVEPGMEPVEPADPTELYTRAIGYLERYLAYFPNDDKVIMQVANTYLYQLSDCTNGVKYFQQLLALDPNNCDAKKAIGFAYFGGVCTTDYTKALKYLLEANECSNGAAPCTDASLVMYIAKAYHLRGAARDEAKQDGAKKDYEQAYNWYGKVLKCEPGNAEAKKGQDDLKFEF